MIYTVEQMILLINSFLESDEYIKHIFLNGSCYKFHLMLKNLAPECVPMISKKGTHIVTLFKEKYFDITGIVEGDFRFLTDEETLQASTWSFSKNMMLKIYECPVCEEYFTYTLTK